MIIENCRNSSENKDMLGESSPPPSERESMLTQRWRCKMCNRKQNMMSDWACKGSGEALEGVVALILLACSRSSLCLSQSSCDISSPWPSSPGPTCSDNGFKFHPVAASTVSATWMAQVAAPNGPVATSLRRGALYVSCVIIGISGDGKREPDRAQLGSWIVGNGSWIWLSSNMSYTKEISSSLDGWPVKAEFFSR